MVSLLFLTFDVFILTLYSSNITCDCSFVTFGGYFFFSHVIVPLSHSTIPTLHLLGHMSNLLEHMLCKLANPLTKRTLLITGKSRISLVLQGTRV